MEAPPSSSTNDVLSAGERPAPETPETALTITGSSIQPASAAGSSASVAAVG